MEQVLNRYNPWWDGEFKMVGIFERAEAIENMLTQLTNNQVIFLTGLRRIGKTTLLKVLIKQLIDKQGIHPKHILYISLDDYLLAKYSIIEIVNEYRRIQRLSVNDFVYLFFDEITYKNDFEIQLKNLYDSQSVKIYATSSSASLLRSKKAYLTGRHKTIELLPLDFNEYLLFKQIKTAKADGHLLAEHFDDYLQTGGIPEFVVKGDITYLQTLVDDIIYKDIAAQHNIRNTQVLRDYFLLLMERSGKQVSINKIAAILQVSPDTSKRYLELFADTFLIYTINRFGKTNERLISPKKVYAADLGIRNVFTGIRDKGSLFENYVYLKIKHLNPSYIYQDTCEIDFITSDKKLIEAKYHNEPLSLKQQKLFDEFKALNKFVIRDSKMLDEMLGH